MTASKLVTPVRGVAIQVSALSVASTVGGHPGVKQEAESIVFVDGKSIEGNFHRVLVVCIWFCG